MNQTETTTFFRALHNVEDTIAKETYWLEKNKFIKPKSAEYAEGYDSVMDDVKYAIMSGDVKDIYQLDEFINHLDAYAEDNKPGDFADGYQVAVNVCLKAVSDLLE